MEIDGYCKELNLGFEYNGEQHFQKSLFGQNEKKLDLRKQDDKQKVDLCNKMGVSLIVITYKDDIKKLPQLLKKKLAKFKLDLKEIDFGKNIDFDEVYRHKTFIQKMRDYAEEHGGKCISTKYVNARTKMKWECSQGHIWETTPDNVAAGKWCKICAGFTVLTIEKMQELANERGGKCLSTKFSTAKGKLKWQCEFGHTWEATPNDVIYQKTWCPDCGGTKKLTIELMQKIAGDRGGKCLSTEYKNIDDKLEWQCSKGHHWHASAASVKGAGAWCLECQRAKIRLSIEEMHAIAKTRGGKCLSTEYFNSRTPLEWECSRGHRWMAPGSSVKNNRRWCKKCMYLNMKEATLKKLCKIAEERGGKCLSNEFIHDNKPLLWECSENHRWHASAKSVRTKQTWCKECENSKSVV